MSRQHAHKVYILILHGGTEYPSSAVIHYCSFKYWLQVAHDYTVCLWLFITVFSGFEGRGWRLTEAFTKTPSYMWPSGSSVCACCELSRCFWKRLVKHWAARNGEEDMSPGKPCFHGNKRFPKSEPSAFVFMCVGCTWGYQGSPEEPSFIKLTN